MKKHICILCRSEVHPVYYRASDGSFKRLGYLYWCTQCKEVDDLSYLYTDKVVAGPGSGADTGAGAGAAGRSEVLE